VHVLFPPNPLTCVVFEFSAFPTTQKEEGGDCGKNKLTRISFFSLIPLFPGAQEANVKGAIDAIDTVGLYKLNPVDP
jgi:hypothetical protein